MIPPGVELGHVLRDYVRRHTPRIAELFSWSTDVKHLPPPRVRIARPSRDPAVAGQFYVRALELQVLASFTDHAGFDGVIVGRPGWPCHLEFTRHRSHAAIPCPTEEDLLVVYLPDRSRWMAAAQRIRDTGARSVSSNNPYWSERGITFEDPDGYRLVLENAAWP